MALTTAIASFGVWSEGVGRLLSRTPEVERCRTWQTWQLLYESKICDEIALCSVYEVEYRSESSWWVGSPRTRIDLVYVMQWCFLAGHQSSGPDFGRILVGKHQNRYLGRPKAGRRAEFCVFPMRIRPKSFPERRCPAVSWVGRRLGPHGPPLIGPASYPPSAALLPGGVECERKHDCVT